MLISVIIIRVRVNKVVSSRRKISLARLIFERSFIFAFVFSSQRNVAKYSRSTGGKWFKMSEFRFNSGKKSRLIWKIFNFGVKESERHFAGAKRNHARKTEKYSSTSFHRRFYASLFGTVSFLVVQFPLLGRH